MAIVIKRGNTLHLQYYDTIKGKTNSKSLKMKATVENERKAKEIAKKFQKEISVEYDKTRDNPFRASTISEAFDHFLEINRMNKQKTIKNYWRFYNYFTNSFDPSTSVNEINKRTYEAWLLDLRNLDQKPNSIHGIAVQGGHFLNFLFQYEYIDQFIVNKRVKTSQEINEVLTFTDQELKAIFTNLNNKNDNFRFTVNLLYFTGLRSKDVLSITTDKIDFKNKTITFFNNKNKSKNSKWVTVPYHTALCNFLKKRVNVIGAGKLIEYANEDVLSRAVNRYFKQIGIENRGLSARTFRKTFISKLRSKGIDESIVQKLVAHKPTSVMDNHYNKVHITNMRKTLKHIPNLLKKYE
ncbi:MAG: site-specific integrase [Melioribacteraceae bacterium]|nr:site-specific integrase [Melioribacteraceae bacterium]MCF8395721.1 site-specific integrase [Melioribacteraceae bacterium]MCF8421207.1 site-specific integrase [Melioribacteraceae bacterium]